MKTRWITSGLLLAFAGLAFCAWQALAQQPATVYWIWFNEGDPTKSAPAETRYFRKVFKVDRAVGKVDEASLDVTADNQFTVWVNGKEVGKGDDWHTVRRFDVQKLLVPGPNVIAVEAKNAEPGPAGLLVRLNYVPNGQSKLTVPSDGSWKVTKKADDGWQKTDFDDEKWSPVKVLGPVGKAGPWGAVQWDGTPVNERFTVPEGFRVELAVKIPPTDANFSLVNMTFDAKGRLLVSREGGPVMLCTDPDKNGVLQKVTPYCEQVKNCQGMCWAKDALYLVGDGTVMLAGKPQRYTGLFRCRDTDGDDKIDEVVGLHKFRGGMGEHGPHAVRQGPDGFLYVVIGNHAWAQIGPDVAKDGPNPGALAANSPLLRWPMGRMGPDQDKPGSTEDVLLKRLNDANGHAADILAPGGTIWRMDQDGQNMSLVAAGFRNQFDAAFSPAGELFTFDSDMEWDEGLPWYRAVRVCHCPPGADFVWRTGAANTPAYYIDSLPPVLETGRGSPVGVEFYDHHLFPAKYRGAFFMADWSIGTIWVVHPERAGATYTGKAEKFCSGSPMNVTDLEVAPDGSLYFTLGGRGTQGGVYRIVPIEKKEAKDREHAQPLAAWSRAATAKAVEEAIKKEGREKTTQGITRSILPGKDGEKVARRDPVYLLGMMQMHGLTPDLPLLKQVLAAREPEVRAQAVWLIGVNGYKDGEPQLVTALADSDPLVRRRACEAFIRADIEPPVQAVWPLLSDRDRFVRTAARLVLQRIDAEKWQGRIIDETNDLAAWEAIIALCKNDALPGKIAARLDRDPPTETEPLLQYLRTVQMALLHGKDRGGLDAKLAARCEKLFPHDDARVNRELAILLAYFGTQGKLKAPPQASLIKAIEASKNDRPQQIHYAYCLRVLREGWTPEQAAVMAAWYDSTRTWTGGNSYTPFLANIFRDILYGYSVAERKQVLANGEKTPLATLVLAQRLQNDRQPELLPDLDALAKRLEKAPNLPRGAELKQAVADAMTRTVLQNPKEENWQYLVRGLHSTNPVVIFEVIDKLKQSETKPKPEDAAAYRALILASRRLDEKSRWKAVELLRRWSGDRRFGAEEGQWKEELGAWAKWFAQTFPKEPALPDTAGDRPVEAKYKFDELLAFLTKPEGKGDAGRGRKVFEKGQCIKCHRYGKEGEGIGPDLTAVSKRFKRADTLEAIYYPSKVISDQYRALVTTTKKGQQFTGITAVVGDTVTVLQADGTKVTLKKGDIDTQFASLVSNMPEKLLDELTKEEIADLFAFLESEPVMK